jgi:mono/diheme cytochrome c family protein
VAKSSIILSLAIVFAACGSSGQDDARPGPSASASGYPSSDAAESASSAPSGEKPTLTFKKLGKEVAKFDLDAMLAKIPAETITQFDPYYSKEKSYRAVPLVRVLDLAFPNDKISEVEYVLRAKDGYTVPMRGSLATEPGAYIAFEDVNVPGWEPIGQQKANPAPFYLIWAKNEQQNLDTHPRPYELATIEIAKFEEVFPHTAPTGIAEGEPARRGFEIFKEQCVLCHAINREGGRVGPDLNVPQSVVEYRPAEQIKAYIKNPLTFRYSQMPPHPNLSEAQLDDVVAYFTAMKDRKSDPDATSHPATAPPPKPAPSAKAKPPPGPVDPFDTFGHRR